MACTRVAAAGFIVLACVVLSPRVTRAQQASGIAGAVKDAAGQPVAGVTVEAASAALIERVRTVVSNAQGLYQITDLPPGIYSVTFTAAGFVTLKTEGIELPAAFSATVNGSLRAGNPTETVTVTATTSQVDTRRSAAQSVVSAETARERASGTGAAQQVTSVAPAIVNPTVDVGGTAGAYASTGNSMAVRGKQGIIRMFDGMTITNMESCVGGCTSYMPNTAAIDQTIAELGSGTAESYGAGGFLNYVPKSGSNRFAFRASGLGSTGKMQADNFDAALAARGLTGVNKVDNIWDITATAGGPVVKDKLWFFFAPKAWGNRNYSAGVFWNDTQGSPYYTPANGTGIDMFGVQRAAAGLPVRPGDQFEVQNSYPVRLTWQATAKDKFNSFVDFPATGCTCRSLPTITSPEATGNYIWGRNGHLWQIGLFQGSWSETTTSKLLLEGGWSFALGGFPGVYHPTVDQNTISVTDLGKGFTYNDTSAVHTGLASNPVNVSDRMYERFSASYVTGTHNLKVGITDQQGWKQAYTYVNHDMTYQFLNGVPNRITEYGNPYTEYDVIKADLAIFAQDRWAIKRLTLTYGLRFSYFNAGAPAQSAAPTPLVPFTRSFSAVNCVPCWEDLDPRVGAVYDLFGNGKTALKGAFGRYVVPQVMVIVRANNPYATSVQSVTRTWNDPQLTTSPALDGNYTPNCDLTNPAANGDCGPISNFDFGLANPNAVKYAPDVVNGFGHRDYIWDTSVEIQHQLTTAITVTGGFYRNSYGNLSVQQNQLTTPAQYDPFCVTAPLNASLPAGGGNQLCGFYDTNLAAFGRVQNLITQSSHFGSDTLVNDFLGFQINARLPRGVRLGGSIDTGRTTSNDCFVVDSPMQLTYNAGYNAAYINGNSPILGVGTISSANPTYCHEVLPFMGNLLIRMNGTYPLPAGFAVSANFSNSPGVMDLAVWNAPNSAIAPTLGRNLSACGTNPVCTATFAVPLIQPGTDYEARRSQLDLRFNKTLKLSTRILLTGNLGIYNVLNANNVLSDNQTYGSNWLKPTRVMDGRLFQLAARVDF